MCPADAVFLTPGGVRARRTSAAEATASITRENVAVSATALIATAIAAAATTTPASASTRYRPSPIVKPEQVRSAVAEHRPLPQVRPEAEPTDAEPPRRAGSAAGTRSTPDETEHATSNANLIARPGRTSRPFHTLAHAATSTAPASRIQPDRPGCSATATTADATITSDLDDARADVARRPALRRGRGSLEGRRATRSSTSPAAKTSIVAARAPHPARRHRGSTERGDPPADATAASTPARGPASAGTVTPRWFSTASRPALIAAAPPCTSRGACDLQPLASPVRRSRGVDRPVARCVRPGDRDLHHPEPRPDRVDRHGRLHAEPARRAAGRRREHAAVNARCPESGASARKRDSSRIAAADARLTDPMPPPDCGGKIATAMSARPDRTTSSTEPRPVSARPQVRVGEQPDVRRRQPIDRSLDGSSLPRMAGDPQHRRARRRAPPRRCRRTSRRRRRRPRRTRARGAPATCARPVLLVTRGHEGDDPATCRPSCRRRQEPRGAVLRRRSRRPRRRSTPRRIRAPCADAPIGRSTLSTVTSGATDVSSTSRARRSVTNPSSDARLSPAPETTRRSTNSVTNGSMNSSRRGTHGSPRPRRPRRRPSGPGPRRRSTSRPRCPAPTTSGTLARASRRGSSVPPDRSPAGSFARRSASVRAASDVSTSGGVVCDSPSSVARSDARGRRRPPPWSDAR